MKRFLPAAGLLAAACVLFPAQYLFAQRQPPQEITPPTRYDFSKLKKEKLGRGVIAIRQSPDEVFVTWRYLSKDPRNVMFDVYRDGKKVNAEPVTEVTYFIDRNKGGGTYAVKPVIGGKELEEQSVSYNLPESAPVGYVDIPLDKPADGTDPNGERYTYSPNGTRILRTTHRSGMWTAMASSKSS